MTQRWLIVFADLDPLPVPAPVSARVLHWLLEAALRPGFRHCFAIRPTRRGYVVLNPHSWGLDILTLDGGEKLTDSPYTADEWWRGINASAGKGRIHTVWASVQPGQLSIRPLLTCVAAVKHLLRLDSRAITPFQLYRHLTKEN